MIGCHYCGIGMTRPGCPAYGADRTIDHVVPLGRYLGRGGLSRLNLVEACFDCNGEKASLTGDEYMAWRRGYASRLDRPHIDADWWLRLRHGKIEVERLAPGKRRRGSVATVSFRRQLPLREVVR